MSETNTSLNEVLNIYVVFPVVHLYIAIFKVIGEKALLVFVQNMKYFTSLKC